MKALHQSKDISSPINRQAIGVRVSIQSNG